jgi:hypothetical protein
VRAGLTLLVLVLDFVALASILAVPGQRRSKLLWCTAVVLLPVVGGVAWLAFGRTRTGMVAIPHDRQGNPGR